MWYNYSDMLSKKYRFHSRGGVRFTYQKGKTIRTPKISLVFNENTRGRQRFAVVISKKVIKSAVGRNRVRRRVYEAIRMILPDFKDKKDKDVTSRTIINIIYNDNSIKVGDKNKIDGSILGDNNEH